MGLDMYLTAEKYISGYEHNDAQEVTKFKKILKQFGAEDLVEEQSPSCYFKVTCAYWRKANAIHKWFVDNMQEGKDDCRECGVDSERLQELVDLCTKVLADPTLAPELLPSQEGFFFGGTSYDKWYLKDLEYTKDRLTMLLKTSGWSFAYRSSW